jgi:hypothetical protein
LIPDGIDFGTWCEIIGPVDPVWQTLVRPELGLYAASLETGYVIGGLIQNFAGDRSFAIPGLIAFDFASKHFTNLTTAGLYSPSGMAFAGSAQFVPSFGKAGLLVMIGGRVPSVASDVGGALRPMPYITIFDIHEGKWYSQTASGDDPLARKNFSMVGVMSSNSNTYEM